MLIRKLAWRWGEIPLEDGLSEYAAIGMPVMFHKSD